jgi:hypothetical protein
MIKTLPNHIRSVWTKMPAFRSAHDNVLMIMFQKVGMDRQASFVIMTSVSTGDLLQKKLFGSFLSAGKL